jgi:hypothetical protein
MDNSRMNKMTQLKNNWVPTSDDAPVLKLANPFPQSIKLKLVENMDEAKK